MDPQVHDFASEIVPGTAHARSNVAYKNNGWNNIYPDQEKASLGQRKHQKRDIAERGMDPEVHGFVEEALPPLNTRIR